MLNLNQITVPSLDIEESIDFYKKLGLELIVYSAKHYARFVCPIGNATFSIHLIESQSIANGIWVYFEIEKLDSFVEELQAKGLKIDELPEDKPWLWREARLKDPFGNQIIFYKAGENRLNPPWRIR